jgi:hypothetical protein
MAKGGKKNTTTSTNTLDGPTQAMQGQVYGAAGAAANTRGIGPDAGTLDAMKGYGAAADFGNQGLLALSGDATAMKNFQTPGQQAMLDQMDLNANQAGQAATNATNMDATRAGAFGGDRAAIAQGTAQAGVNTANMQQKNAYTYQNNQDAVGRAMAAANLGFGANQARMQGGQYLQALNQANDPATRKLAMLKMGLMGTPYGTTQTNTTETPWGSIIGGGIMSGVGAYMGAKG